MYRRYVCSLQFRVCIWHCGQKKVNVKPLGPRKVCEHSKCTATVINSYCLKHITIVIETHHSSRVWASECFSTTIIANAHTNQAVCMSCGKLSCGCSRRGKTEVPVSVFTMSSTWLLRPVAVTHMLCSDMSQDLFPPHGYYLPIWASMNEPHTRCTQAVFAKNATPVSLQTNGVKGATMSYYVALCMI